jgi:hypothetical protein
MPEARACPSTRPRGARPARTSAITSSVFPTCTCRGSPEYVARNWARSGGSTCAAMVVLVALAWPSPSARVVPVLAGVVQFQMAEEEMPLQKRE